MSVAFLIAIISVLGLILFLSEEYAQILAIDDIRNEYKKFLGLAFLAALFFCAERCLHFLMQQFKQNQNLKKMQKNLHTLTPEEKNYLIPYIKDQKNTQYIGLEDGVMAGLRSKNITYCPTVMGNIIEGFAFNLEPWAREYLEKNPHLLNSYADYPRN
ncbi:MAG: super-infection exclusion protein B [Gammaproteobacteria bacterium]|nr:super-infection exclusion protein B [Gammaproteobacteria bacterium]